jgi:WD40 repeat protein/TM2 domain-containing membrane protein YozV
MDVKKKEAKKAIAYLLWAIGFFPFIGGLHRLYLKKWVSGTLYLLTFGFFFIGQLCDIFFISGMVEKYNFALQEENQTEDLQEETNTKSFDPIPKEFPPLYQGELPQCLNPLNIRHYFLLLHWIFFRPSGLKSYLYQADPELYRTGSGLNILRTLFIRAYRNLYLIAIGVSILSFILILLLPLISVFLWLCCSGGLGMAFGGLALAGMVLGGFALIGMVWGLLGGVARGVFFGISRGVLYGVVQCVKLSMTFSLPLVIALLMAGKIDENLSLALLALAVGLGFGLAFSAVGGIAGCLALDVGFVMLIGVVSFFTFDFASKIIFAIAFAIGSLRLYFYLFEFFLALRSQFWGTKHPIEWDELIVLPLPGTQKLISQRLHKNELDGLLFAANLARNPFQRWIVQRSLKAYLNNHRRPLYLLYSLLTTPELNTYNDVPVSKKDWQKMLTKGQFLLGIISGLAVNSKTGWANNFSEYLVFNLTWIFRDKRKTPLIDFAKMLYRLDNINSYPDSFTGYSIRQVLKNKKAYTELTLYPDSEEITRSFTTLTIFLNYNNSLSLPSAGEMLSGLTPHETSIRSSVLTALVCLSTIGEEVDSYQKENSDSAKKSILVKLTQNLEKIYEFVDAEVTTPEKIILQKIIKKWAILVKYTEKDIEEKDNQTLDPAFPSYRGSVPRYLNPLYLRHYFLLADWIYFRPTAFHNYLYQASPEIYQIRSISKLFQTWRIKAYRNLYLMALATVTLSLFLSVLLTIPETLLTHGGTINAVTVIPNEQMAISADSDGTVKRWEFDYEPPLSLFPKNIAALFNINLKKTDKTAWNWKERFTWYSGARNVTAVAITPNKQYVVTGLADSTSFNNIYSSWGIIPYLAKTFNVKVQYRYPYTSSKNIEISGVGVLKVWKWENGEELYTLKKAHDGAINSIAITPDGSKAISASDDKTLKVWDLSNGDLLHTLKGHEETVNGVAITPDGSKAISASDDKTLKVWNLSNGHLLHTLKGHKEAVNGVAITPDGNKAVSASEDKILRVWNLRNGRVLNTLKAHQGAVNAVAITKDGKKAVSASDDFTLKVWDINSGRVLNTLKGHGGEVKTMALTSDGKKAISFSGLRRFWDLEKGVELKRANRLLTHFSLTKIEPFLRLILVISGFFASSLLLGVGLAIWGGVGVVINCFLSMVILALSSNDFYSLIRYIFVPLVGILPQTLLVVFWNAFYSFNLLVFGMVGGLVNRKASWVVFSLFFTAVTWFLNFGIYADVIPSPETNVVQTILVKILGSMGIGLLGSAIYSVLFIPSISRFIFHPIYCALALRSRWGKGKHPVEWDELIVLPLPGTQKTLTRRLQQNEAKGLHLLAEVAGNPFQRAFAQKVLHTYLHQQVAPLRFLYCLLTAPQWQTYIYAPIGNQDWKSFPTVGKVLLGELGGEWVDYGGGWFNRQAERLVWKLTQIFRDHRQTSLTLFAAMLYQLSDVKVVRATEFDLSSYAQSYRGLISSPEGAEIVQIFDLLSAFLTYKQLSDLADAVKIAPQSFSPETAIAPTVVTALAILRTVGTEVATYQASTSRVNQFEALARGTKILDDLAQYVANEVITPEKEILKRIIAQWKPILTDASGNLANQKDVAPVTNPYVLNNPVRGTLFVGREDIMRRLEELWRSEQSPSVVIYGHRRMGKTSILQNLGVRFGSNTVIVDFNMQRIGSVDNTGQLLYYLAVNLYDRLSLDQQTQLQEPKRKEFREDPYFVLDRFLKRLDKIRAEHRFIITIDEFELIEEQIRQKRLETKLLDFWRGLIQTYPWFIMAFAGLHTLEEMTKDYWHPLYGSVMRVSVSFLERKAAERLIVQPTPDFNIDYDLDAVERIIDLTNGQPYLVQLICHTLITRFNHQTLEQGIERERRFSIEEVEAIVNTAGFYLQGNAYFAGVWKQVQKEDNNSTQRNLVLQVLSQAKLSLTEITERTTLNLAQIQSDLDILQSNDVIKQEDGRYGYTVELMRRWVTKNG